MSELMINLGVTETYLDDFTAGSYFQKLANGYSVKVRQESGRTGRSEGGWKTFTAGTLAGAYLLAMDYLRDKEKADAEVSEF